MEEVVVNSFTEVVQHLAELHYGRPSGEWMVFFEILDDEGDLAWAGATDQQMTRNVALAMLAAGRRLVDEKFPEETGLD
jgi:hypothetical protein